MNVINEHLETNPSISALLHDKPKRAKGGKALTKVGEPKARQKIPVGSSRTDRWGKAAWSWCLASIELIPSSTALASRQFFQLVSEPKHNADRFLCPIKVSSEVPFYPTASKRPSPALSALIVLGVLQSRIVL